MTQAMKTQPCHKYCDIRKTVNGSQKIRITYSQRITY